jgi:hypothetical protein
MTAGPAPATKVPLWCLRENPLVVIDQTVPVATSAPVDALMDSPTPSMGLSGICGEGG